MVIFKGDYKISLEEAHTVIFMFTGPSKLCIGCNVLEGLPETVTSWNSENNENKVVYSSQLWNESSFHENLIQSNLNWEGGVNRWEGGGRVGGGGLPLETVKFHFKRERMEQLSMWAY